MKNKLYSIQEAIVHMKKENKNKNYASIDIDLVLNIEYKTNNIPIRIQVNLPYGNGKKYKILSMVEKEKRNEIKKNNNIKIGFKKYIEKIQKGWTKFDILIATPKTMQSIVKLVKILGPKGLMPNTMLGTVNNNPQKIINEINRGKIFLKSDRYGIMHTSIGRINFTNTQILENLKSLLYILNMTKTQHLKGNLIKKIYISSTMGRSYRIKP
ncbi:50S ribosomal protein L1 [Candidatus Karelsulcia muelleri]|uniref:50S ribosomal protein L1 n=1 Tax=Candidatus Karelsulcia muelleri TaxID=336810 RepID=UPI002364A213|nr:50S ribosomal protein L1 [Candidatus Karelsulcia muelleri]WDE42203.1 50S ribosomal protein L1 [Candidatus Karelsulcia muelleri]WDR79049.1 50S ribosomal protein L1 [Candidatus Karelsulcia muelleri]